MGRKCGHTFYSSLLLLLLFLQTGSVIYWEKPVQTSHCNSGSISSSNFVDFCFKYLKLFFGLFFHLVQTHESLSRVSEFILALYAPRLHLLPLLVSASVSGINTAGAFALRVFYFSPLLDAWPLTFTLYLLGTSFNSPAFHPLCL